MKEKGDIPNKLSSRVKAPLEKQKQSNNVSLLSKVEKCNIEQDITRKKKGGGKQTLNLSSASSRPA